MRTRRTRRSRSTRRRRRRSTICRPSTSWRGTALAFLSCALVGFDNTQIRDVWLQALLAKLPKSLVDLDVRGSWDGTARPSPRRSARPGHSTFLRTGRRPPSRASSLAASRLKFASIKALDIACSALAAADVGAVEHVRYAADGVAAGDVHGAVGDAALKSNIETLDLEV